MDDHSELGQLKSKVEALEARIKELEGSRIRQDWPRPEDVDRLFLELFSMFDNFTLQYLIREASLKVWAHASVKLPLQLLARIRSCVSANAWLLFVDYARETEFTSEIDRSRQEILKLVYRDWQCGFIQTIREDTFLPWSGKGDVVMPFKTSEPDPERMAAFECEEKAIQEWKEVTLREVEKVPREGISSRLKKREEISAL